MASPTSLLPINVFPLVVGDLVQRKIDAGGTAGDFFFVQIGAHDGVHYDPIRPFVEKYHWRGLLVEPQPEVYQRLVANYASEPQLMFAKAAVAPQNGKATLYTFKKSPGSRPLTSSANVRLFIVPHSFPARRRGRSSPHWPAGRAGAGSKSCASALPLSPRCSSSGPRR